MKPVSSKELPKGFCIRRFAFGALAAAFAADTATRLVSYMAAFSGGGTVRAMRVLFADADGRMFFSAALGFLLFFVGCSRYLSGLAERFTLGAAVITLSFSLILLHVAVLPGQTGFYALGLLLILWLLFSAAGAILCVIRSYRNFTNNHFTGESTDDRTT